MIFLVDNGSVRVEAYKNLSEISQKLSQSIGENVSPAPLLHADKIPREDLGNMRVRLFEEQICESYDQGNRSFTVFPLFFGPSAALVDYLPRRLEILSTKRPGFSVRVLNPLFGSTGEGGELLADILEERVHEVVRSYSLKLFHVILVDHGSPKSEVTDVRNRLAELMSKRFESLSVEVFPASMERRPGIEYDFNEPLLETALINPIMAEKPIVLAQLFFSPGRHAGPNGDIERICVRAEKDNPNMKVYRAELVGNHPRLIKLLAQRWAEREQLPMIHY